MMRARLNLDLIRSKLLSRKSFDLFHFFFTQLGGAHWNFTPFFPAVTGSYV